MHYDTTVTHEVCRLFADDLHIDVPSTSTDLVETGLLDSLMLVNLFHELEQTFGITVVMDTLELDDFRSVDTIAAYVSTARSRVAS